MTGPRRIAVGWLACLCLLAAACLEVSTAQAPTPDPAEDSTPAPASQPPLGNAAPMPEQIIATPLGAETAPAVTHLPLSLLAPSAAEAAGELGENVGIAVYYPSEGRIYEYNAQAQFELVSVVKVPIMLTLLDKAIAERRQLTADETALVTAMIRESDNDATTALWYELGGAKTVQRFLDSAGVSGATIDPHDWGDSVMPAAAGAELLGKLVEGQILDASSRQFAMRLMSEVDPSQDWGAVTVSSFAAETGVKNGWYPEHDGWVLNSFGYALPDDASPEYTIAIFSRGHATFGQGRQAIEELASLIHLDAASR